MGNQIRITIATYLMLLCVPASAVPVTWTLQNVYLADGVTQITGSFVYDADAPHDACSEWEGGIYPNCYGSSYASQQYSSIYIESSQPIYNSYYDLTGELDINDGRAQYNDWDLPPAYGFSSSYMLQLNGNLGTINNSDNYMMLRLSFGEQLTNAGGEVQLTGFWNPDAYNYYNSSFDLNLSGSVVANVVPIPAAVCLFGSALAGLGWLRRKQPV